MWIKLYSWAACEYEETLEGLIAVALTKLTLIRGFCKKQRSTGLTVMQIYVKRTAQFHDSGCLFNDVRGVRRLTTKEVLD